MYSLLKIFFFFFPLHESTTFKRQRAFTVTVTVFFTVLCLFLVPRDTRHASLQPVSILIDTHRFIYFASSFKTRISKCTNDAHYLEPTEVVSYYDNCELRVQKWQRL